jgi:hypothetical protein
MIPRASRFESLHAISRVTIVCLLFPVCAAADQVVVRDRFDGATLAGHLPDTNLPNSTWSATGSGATLWGQRAWAGGSDWAGILATIDSGVADGTVAVDWTPGAETPYGAVIARASDPANYLIAYYWSGALSLSRVTSNGQTLLASTPIADPGSAVHRMMIVLAGSSIQVWYDGVRRLSATDAFNVAVTRHGFRWLSHYDWLSTYGNFEVDGAYVPPAATVTVTPSPVQVSLLASTTLTATAYDAAHRAIPGMNFSWTSSNPSAVAIVAVGNNTASAIALGGGSATITATPTQGASGVATVTVNTGPVAVLDTFTAADATRLSAHSPDVSLPSTAWSVTGSGVALNGNVARAGGADWDPITALIDSGTADGTIGVDWTPAGPTPAAAVVARAASATSYITALYWSRTLSLFRVSDGSHTLLGQAPVADLSGATHRLELKLAGAEVEVWWDRVQQIVATDAFNATATRHGFRWYSYWDWQSTYDRFEVSALPAISSVTVTPAGVEIPMNGGRVLTAQAYDAAGSPIAGVSFSWRSSDGGVASTSVLSPTSGAIVAEGTGRASITAVAFGGRAQASVEVTVTPPPPLPPTSPSPTTCMGGVFPSGMTWPADGGIGEVTLSAPVACEWIATSSVLWMIPLQSAGAGDRIATYAVDANTTGSPRSGTLSYGGATFVVSQTAVFTNPTGVGDPCRAATIWPSSGFFGPAGGDGRFDVTIASGCQWTAVVNGLVPWVHTSSAGAGPDGVAYTVDSMSGAATRSAVISIGTATFTIIQSATSDDGAGDNSAQLDVAPAGAVVLPRRISGALAVMTAPGHGWTASANASWLSLWTSSGAGSATLWYVAEANPSPSDRTGVIEVADGTTTVAFAVVQHGSGLVRPTSCRDGECEPDPDDCYYTPGGGAEPIEDPWCEDWPTPTDDPHCRNKPLPRSRRVSRFGDGLECVESTPIPAPQAPTGIFAKAHKPAEPLQFRPRVIDDDVLVGVLLFELLDVIEDHRRCFPGQSDERGILWRCPQVIKAGVTG